MTSRTLPNHEALKRFVIAETIGAAIVNALAAMFAAWLEHRHAGPMPVYGSNGLLTDVTITTFLTGFLITVILTPITRYRVRSGRAPRLNRHELPAAWRLLPRRTFLAGLLLGIACAAVVLGIARTAMLLVQAREFSPLAVIVIKAALGGLLGLVFAPVIVLRALSESPAPARAELLALEARPENSAAG